MLALYMLFVLLLGIPFRVTATPPLSCVVNDGQMDTPLAAHLDPIWWQLPERRLMWNSASKKFMPPNPLIRNPNFSGRTHVPGTTSLTILSMRAKAVAGHFGLQGMQTPSVNLYPWTTAGAHLVNYHQSLHVYLPRFCHASVILATISGTTPPKREPQSRLKTLGDVESLDTPAPLTSCLHESFHPVHFGIMPKRRPLPHPHDEIPCDHEKNVSSIQDGYTACFLCCARWCFQRARQPRKF